jgi:hypothetical protein
LITIDTAEDMIRAGELTGGLGAAPMGGTPEA